jgi:HEPN domain-containing protein
LPIVAYAHSLSALLTAAAIDEPDTRTLLVFFNEVATLNRGLDQVDRARLITDPVERDRNIDAEYRRNRLKAEPLAGEYYDRARAVVDSRLHWYKF